MRKIALLSMLCLSLACSDDEDSQRSDAGTDQDGQSSDGQDGDGESADGESADGTQDGAAGDGESTDGSTGDGDPGTSCESLSIERCREDDRCSVTELKPWNEDGSCWNEPEAAGCLSLDGGCTSEVSCWLDPAGGRWLKGGCPPVGWTVTECDGYAACE